jgi:predicted nucleic acid-binding protein
MVTSYLLDTNALSEPLKARRDLAFMAWLQARKDEQLFVSCLSLGELQKGISLLEPSARRSRFEKYLWQTRQGFAGRILGLDSEATLLWGELTALAQASGKTAPSIDSLLAAQAIHHGLCFLTRNTKDFSQFAAQGLELHNPWSDE